MTQVTIVSPGHPHCSGGVTDHTTRLCRHWSEAGHTVHVWSDASATKPGAVAQWHRAGTRSVLIQYVPFLYGRRGLSRVPERIAAEARRIGMRVTTFVHEPWVPPTRLPWLVLGPLQRRQLRRLANASDAVVTPVPKWASDIGPNARVAYVGSTLGDPPPRSGTAALTGPVVFSPFAAGLNWEWIAAAVRAIQASPPLIVVGATHMEARRHPVVRRFIQSGWTWHERAPAGATLDLLCRALLVLAPFVDGLTGRRTSALAAASTGALLLSSKGHLSDPSFDDSPVELAASKVDFVTRALRLWNGNSNEQERRQRQQWYHDHLDARLLDGQLLSVVAELTSTRLANHP